LKRIRNQVGKRKAKRKRKEKEEKKTMSVKEMIKSRLKTVFSGGRCVCRLAAAFAVLTAVNVCLNPGFTSRTSIAGTSLALSFVLFAAIFLLLSALAFSLPAFHTDSMALALGALAAALLLSAYFDRSNFGEKLYFALALTLFLSLALVYFYTKNKDLLARIPLDNKWVIIGFTALGFVFIATMVSIRTVLRYQTYSSPNFDFGIFAQAFRNMKEHGLPVTTCERDRLLSHFAVHFSPVFYLLLPFYMIFPSPITLQISQALLIASGIIPLVLICKKRKLSGAHTLIFILIYSLYPVVQAGTNYDFHENCFLLPLILLAFCAVEYDNMILLYVSCALTLTVKEDAFIYVLFIAVFMIAEKKRRLHALIIGCLSVAYFAFCVFMLTKFGEGVMSDRYSNLLPSDDSGLFGVVKTFFQNFGYVLKELFGDADSPPAKLWYFILLFLPLGTLPFCSKKPSRWLLCAITAMNMVAASLYQYDIGFQYGFGISAFLFYAAVTNFSELDEKPRTALITVALAASIVFWPLFYGGGVSDYIRGYNIDRETYRVMDRVIETVPEDASVAASTFLIPHLADRDILYETEYHSEFDFEYAVLDMRPGYDAVNRSYLEDLLKEGYTIVTSEEDIIIVLYKSQN